MFREGPEGFKGGLSAGKYSTINGRITGNHDARPSGSDGERRIDQGRGTQARPL